MRLYLDSAPVIYVVEQVLPYAAWVDVRLSRQDTILVTSDLTRLECRLAPLRDGKTALLRDFDDFFEAIANIAPLSHAVMDSATEIRARYNFKTPDAIHLAAALASGCDAFLTNDHQLDRFAELAIEIVGT